jgi:hypothetical protein
MNIEFNKEYLSGMIANADLHAGGIFFCIIYQNCLVFFSDGTVALTKKVVDAFRPLDENDILYLKNYKAIGTYMVNDNGYLVCNFESLFWIFTGLPTNKNNDIIPFYIHDSRLRNQWSEVYKLESST